MWLKTVCAPFCDTPVVETDPFSMHWHELRHFFGEFHPDRTDSISNWRQIVIGVVRAPMHVLGQVGLDLTKVREPV